MIAFAPLQTLEFGAASAVLGPAKAGRRSVQWASTQSCTEYARSEQQSGRHTLFPVGTLQARGYEALFAEHSVGKSGALLARGHSPSFLDCGDLTGASLARP
jgi:hypothetical protein